MEPRKILIATPMTPRLMPKDSTTTSSSIRPSDSTTTPSDGSVSRPENGGDRKAPRQNTRQKSPSMLRNSRLLSRELSRGREYFSNHRTRLTINGKAFFWVASPRDFLRRNFGSQTVCSPSNISIASSAPIISVT